MHLFVWRHRSIMIKNKGLRYIQKIILITIQPKLFSDYLRVGSHLSATPRSFRRWGRLKNREMGNSYNAVMSLPAM